MAISNKNILYMENITYENILNLKNNTYFKFNEDYLFLEKNTSISYKEIENGFTGKKVLILEISKSIFDKFSFSKQEDIKILINNIINIDPYLKFIDIDLEEVGIYPDEKKYPYSSFEKYMNEHNIKYLVGHNIINYDKDILENTKLYVQMQNIKFIDTLYLSLFLNKNHSHALKKDYKEHTDTNNPIKDAKESYELFIKELEIFKNLESSTKKAYAYLLGEDSHFETFFKYVNLTNISEYKQEAYSVIGKYFSNLNKIENLIESHKVEFAFILFGKINNYPIPKFVEHNYPKMKNINKKLNNKPINSLSYARQILETKDFKYKSFDAIKNNNNLFNEKISQEDIINSSLNRESLLAILPTGGGKSLCYQIPSVYESETYQGLTLIISPLRSLMKDQIENFNAKFTQTKAGALSGFLSSSERNILIDEVENGKVNILYVAPESLRYKTIKYILNNRNISRIVIDEAHCLSTWGQDFRPDYRYIAKFIKSELKQNNIPISCYTATASLDIIQDISQYFKNHLDMKLNPFIASNKRDNLKYSVIKIDGETKKEIHKNKYNKLLEILDKDMIPAIIYIPDSTHNCDEIAKNLSTHSNFKIEPFHSKTPNREEILKSFIDDDIDIIVATTAFGMGVDKPNIKTVIHYTPSSNIEDYLQESGRAGRDKTKVPKAKCIAFYIESDFDNYLQKLKNSIITSKEIHSIYQAIKNLSSQNKLQASSLEIALEAKWDVDDERKTYKTKINTILTELEDEELIKRDINNTQPFATSIEIATIEEVKEKLNIIDNKNNEENINNQFTIMRLIQKKSRKQISIDETSYLLGIDKYKVIDAINALKDKDLIGNDRDINIRINELNNKYFNVELVLLEHISENGLIKLKDILKEQDNLLALLKDESLSKHKIYSHDTMGDIKLYEKILRHWKNNKHISIKRIDKTNHIWNFQISNIDEFKENITNNIKLSKSIFQYIKSKKNDDINIKVNVKKMLKKLNIKTNNKKIDKLLVYLQYTKSIQLLDGVFIYYTSHNIEVVKKVNLYTIEMYRKRKEPYYDNQRQKIHIMNEFLQKKANNEDINDFLNAYFSLSLKDFIKEFLSFGKYINTFMTKSRLDSIYKKLTKKQKEIVDSKTNSIMVLAGPGSGKTKTLVHKIAHTILNDKSVKRESFLMLTYTRSAVIEFKTRLVSLIGNYAYQLDIHTFHSFVNMITGKTGIKDSNSIKDFNDSKKTDLFPFKTALYLDEYQDINQDTFDLIQNIIKYCDIEKVVAVGDDDQNIMEYNGSDVKFFDKYKENLETKKYAQFELMHNFRSDKGIVELSNNFIKQVGNRKKINKFIAQSNELGETLLLKSESEYLYEIVKNKVVELTFDNKERSLGILMHTNDDTLTLQAFLEDCSIKSSLILDKARFAWRELIEIYDFNEMVFTLLKEKTFSISLVNEAYKIIYDKYKKSIHVDKLTKIKDFFEQNDDYTESAWTYLINDLDDDFFDIYSSKIIITTIHKAKGREFDDVILVDSKNKYNEMLDDKMIRKYYVAITRAKHKLVIITNQNHFDSFFEARNIKYDNNQYEEPKKQIIYLNKKNIKLGGSKETNWKKYNENIIKSELVAGNTVTKNEWRLFKNNLIISELSWDFQEEIKQYEIKYNITNIIVDSVVTHYANKENVTMYLVLFKIEFTLKSYLPLS